jgi:predicted small metal-binding protein
MVWQPGTVRTTEEGSDPRNGPSGIGFTFASSSVKGASMRKLDCQCGHTVEGVNDEELFQRGKQHVAEVHPGENITDDQLRQLIATQAYDA